MDIRNGHILAMSSVPNYDPNQFVRGISKKYWNELINNPDKPFGFKAVSSQYPPGSTFKMLVALAALEKGIITENTHHNCPGYFELGTRRFHCWRQRGHGNVNLPEALSRSCNVYFYALAQKLGIKNISEMATRFGLGDIMGIELPEEKPGLVPTKQWKRATKGEPWYVGETLNSSIGQGYFLATPLQLAVMTARLASRGKNVEPTILFNKEQKDFDQIKISQQHLSSILKGMEMVVNDREGGAYRSRIKDERYLMAGKTGTSQVVTSVSLTEKPKNKEELYHSLFVAYAPINNPRYAISVVVEHGGYGSVMAAPIGRNIMHRVQKMGI